MVIKIIKDKISLKELQTLAKEFYGSMTKGVADIERGVVAFGGEYHMEANMSLIEDGSGQSNLWGFNVYLNKPREDWLEYTSLINIRPAAGNFDMMIGDEQIRQKVKEIVNSKII
ncbi:MAG TPA: DUF5674 family protein [Candidatus Paceibacterota bacterium]